jgi:hypothetical protein
MALLLSPSQRLSGKVFKRASLCNHELLYSKGRDIEGRLNIEDLEIFFHQYSIFTIHSSIKKRRFAS